MITVFTTKDSSNITLCIEVNKQPKTICFKSPHVFGCAQESTFTTSDSATVEALKNHPYFGSIIFIKKEIEPASVAPKSAGKLSPEDCLRDKATAIHDDTVTGKKMAIAYIQGMFNEPLPENLNSVEDFKIHVARTYNVIFDKWK